jgi:hypothetical protein
MAIRVKTADELAGEVVRYRTALERIVEILGQRPERHMTATEAQAYRRARATLKD